MSVDPRRVSGASAGAAAGSRLWRPRYLAPPPPTAAAPFATAESSPSSPSVGVALFAREERRGARLMELRREAKPAPEAAAVAGPGATTDDGRAPSATGSESPSATGAAERALGRTGGGAASVVARGGGAVAAASRRWISSTAARLTVGCGMSSPSLSLPAGEMRASAARSEAVRPCGVGGGGGGRVHVAGS